MVPPRPSVVRPGSSPRRGARHLGVLQWRRVVLLPSLAVLVACSGGPSDDDDGAAAPELPVSSAPAEGSTEGSGDESGREPLAPVIPALHPAIDDLDETIVTISAGAEQVEVVAKVAEAPEERTRGLMEVAELPAGTGMLFLFETERAGGFWMWNTLIELDIAFIGADSEAHTLATMVPCEAERSADCPVTTPPEPYRAALEVPAGWFDSVGVAPGASMTWTEPQPVVGR